MTRPVRQDLLVGRDTLTPAYQRLTAAEVQAGTAGTTAATSMTTANNVATGSVARLQVAYSTLLTTILPIAAALTGITLAMRAAARQRTGQEQLAQTMRDVGLGTNEATEAFERFASQRQDVTRFGDDVTRAIATQFITMSDRSSLSLERIQEGVALTQDVMERMGLGAQSATRIVAAAYAGEATALGRLMPSMRDYLGEVAKIEDQSERAALTIRLLEERFGGAASAIDHTDQAMAEAKNSIGDLIEALGDLLEAMSPLIELVADVTGGIASFVGFVMEGAQNVGRMIGEGVAATVVTASSVLRGLGVPAAFEYGTSLRELGSAGGVAAEGIALATEAVRDWREVTASGTTEDPNAGMRAGGTFERLGGLFDVDEILSVEEALARSEEGDEGRRRGGRRRVSPFEAGPGLAEADKLVEQQRILAEQEQMLLETRAAFMNDFAEARREHFQEFLDQAQVETETRLESHRIEMELANEKKQLLRDLGEAEKARRIAAVESAMGIASAAGQLIGVTLGQGKEYAFFMGGLEAAEALKSLAFLDIRGAIAHGAASVAFFKQASRGGGGGSVGGGGGAAPNPFRPQINGVLAGDGGERGQGDVVIQNNFNGPTFMGDDFRREVERQRRDSKRLGEVRR